MSCHIPLGTLGWGAIPRLSLLPLLRGYCIKRCPPLLYVLALAMRADDPAFLMLRYSQDFREFGVAEVDKAAPILEKAAAAAAKT
jgi:hypothetical protein